MAKESIKKWPKDERPRERLFKYGEHTLTNAELLAVIFRTGVKGMSAVDLARQMIAHFKTFRNMSHVDISEIRSFKGMGDAKIAQLRASFEIARRFLSEPKKPTMEIKSPKEAVDLFMPRLRDIKKEVFQVLLLNARNRIIDIIEVEEGTVDQANPHIREIALKALQNFAAAIIAAHNHPSGDPEPSKEDVIFTKNLATACRALEINILDHIIIGDNRHYSFAEHKRL
ncbi:MAG: DNA repair protein RadC [Candidatus Omnitrophota bacterium]|nr:DNA repair protein RadC [Candidatus Omnitrophota bacterium]